MFVSVAICTWNRATLLDATLRQMRALSVPDGHEWELLVVNNNCSDDTDIVINKYSSDLPTRRLFEPRQGHTHARNCAIHAARGDLLLWTDDDVLVDKLWLSAYIHAAAQHPECDFFGGRIDPWFESEPPRWLRDIWPKVAGLYAVRQFDEEVLDCDSERIPYGANFAVRIDTQRKYLFDPRLGRRGSQLSAGDETTLLRRMIADGVRGRWIHDAIVQHYIPGDRLSAAYVRGNFFHQGRQGVMQRQDADRDRLRKAMKILVKAIRAEFRCRLTSRNIAPAKWLEAARTASHCWGALSELRKRRETRPALVQVSS